MYGGGWGYAVEYYAGSFVGVVGLVDGFEAFECGGYYVDLGGGGLWEGYVADVGVLWEVGSVGVGGYEDGYDVAYGVLGS